ncbi:hypothetical protein ACEPPN_016266 [Leptodophora sp. 'Broadleaf-Isolate-01']
MAKIEEKKLEQMRAQIMASRQAGGGQRVPSQSGQVSSSASTIWNQMAAARYAQERSTAQQQPPTSHPTNAEMSGMVFYQQSVSHPQAPATTQRSTSSIGIGNMSVNDRNPGQQGAMNSAYGNTGQSMRRQQDVGAMNKRPTDEIEAHEMQYSTTKQSSNQEWCSAQ